MTHRKNPSLSSSGPVSRRLLSLALLAFLLCMTGCKSSSKDEDDEDDKDSKTKSELLVGFWEKVQEPDDISETHYVAFMEDGTFIPAQKGDAAYYEAMGPERVPTYRVKGRELTVEYPFSPDTQTYTIRKLDDTTLILVDEDSKETIKFKRIDKKRFSDITGISLSGMSRQEELVDAEPDVDEVSGPEPLETPELKDTRAPAVKGGKEVQDNRAPAYESQPSAPQPKVEPAPQPKPAQEDDKVFQAVEQQAQFPGGTGALYNWLANNLRYPENAQQNGVEGKVIVQFIVEKDGTISSPKVARGVDKDLDREALRIVKQLPRWTPARNNGVAVRSWFTLPVVFKLTHS